jgi:hypothetical protein
MAGGEVNTGLLLGNPKERNQLEELGVDGREILEYIFKKLVDRTWNGLIWLRKIKCLAVVIEGNFLSEDVLVLKNDSAPFS